MLLAQKCSLEDFIEKGNKCPRCQYLSTEKVWDVFHYLGDLGKSLEYQVGVGTYS